MEGAILQTVGFFSQMMKLSVDPSVRILIKIAVSAFHDWPVTFQRGSVKVITGKSIGRLTVPPSFQPKQQMLESIRSSWSCPDLHFVGMALSCEG
jgi:hypothetical protein